MTIFHGVCAEKSRLTFDGFSFEKPSGRVVLSDRGKIESARLSRGAKLSSGKVGKALRLSGRNSFAKVPYSAKLGFADGAFSIEFWIKPMLDSFPKYMEVIGNAWDRGPGWRLVLWNGRLRFQTGNGEGKEFWCLCSDRKLTLKEWNHVAITRDEEGFLRLYLNGDEVKRSASAFVITPSREDIFIGAMFGKYYPFAGLIDEIRIYDYARSATEMRQDIFDIL